MLDLFVSLTVNIQQSAVKTFSKGQQTLRIWVQIILAVCSYKESNKVSMSKLKVFFYRVIQRCKT